MRANHFFESHPRLRRAAWFVAIYVASLVVFGILLLVLQLLVPR